MGGDIERRTIYKAAWRIMPIVTLGLIVNFLDRVNLGFAALTMNQDLGLTQAVFGFAASVFFIGYILFEVPSNLILNRVGARLWIARIMITWGVVSGATAFVTTAWQLHTVRFLLGVAEAGFNPGIIFYLCLWFPKKYRAQMFGWFMIAQPVAAIISGPISGLILGMEGVAGLKSWQWLFLVEAVPSIILGLAILRFLPNSVADAHWLETDERSWLTNALASEQAEVEKVGVTSLWKAFLNPRLLVLSLGLAGIGACFWCVVFFLPQIVKATGASNLASSFLSAIPYIGGAIAIFVMARVADKKSVLEPILFWASLLIAVGLGGTAYLGTSPWSLVTLTIIVTGSLGFLPVFWAIPPRFLQGTAAAGGLALINTLASLGNFSGPFAFGWLAGVTGGYSGALWTFTGIAAACGVIFLLSGQLTPRSAAANPSQAPAAI